MKSPSTQNDSLKKIREILGITKNPKKEELIAKINARYPNVSQVEKGLILHLSSLLLTELPELKGVTTSVADFFFIENLTNNFRQIRDGLDKDLKEITIATLVIFLQKITKELLIHKFEPLFINDEIAAKALAAIDQISAALEEDAEQVAAIQGVDLETSKFFSEKIYAIYSGLLVWHPDNIIINNLIAKANRFDPNQEGNIHFLINQIIIKGLPRGNQSQLDLDKKLAFFIDNFEKPKIYLKPKKLFDDIIADCRSYQERLPLNAANLIAIFYQQGKHNVILREIIYDEIKIFLDALNPGDEFDILAQKMREDDQFINFLLSKQSTVFWEKMLNYLKLEKPEYTDLIKKITDKNNKKPAQKTSTISHAQIVKKPEFTTPHYAPDLLRKIIGIEESAQLNINQISERINKLDYGDQKANAAIREKLKELSKILLVGKKPSDDVYRDLASAIPSIVNLRKEVKTPESDAILGDIIFIAAYCFMGLILDRAHHRIKNSFTTQTTEDLFKQLLRFIEDTKINPDLIIDKDNIFLNKIKKIYEDFGHYLISSESPISLQSRSYLLLMVIFISNNYPHTEDSIAFLINKLANTKFTKYEPDEFEQLILIFTEIKEEQLHDRHNSFSLSSNCIEFLDRAIDECKFYQNQNLPISTIFQAIVIFNYQKNGSDIINALKEKFSNQLAEYFKNKINSGFEDELPIFIKAIEENDLLKFLVDLFDAQQLEKLKGLLSNKNELKQKIMLLSQEKKRRQKELKKPSGKTAEKPQNSELSVEELALLIEGSPAPQTLKSKTPKSKLKPKAARTLAQEVQTEIPIAPPAEKPQIVIQTTEVEQTVEDLAPEIPVEKVEKKTPLEKAELQIKNLDKQIIELNFEFDRAKKALEKSELAVGEKNKQVEKLARELETSKEKLSKLPKVQQERDGLVNKNAQLGKQKELLLAENEKLKSESAKLETSISKLETQLKTVNLELQKTRAELDLAKSQQQNPKALSAENIEQLLAEKAQQILKKIRDEFGDIARILQENLRNNQIGFSTLDVIGSQAYVPALQILSNAPLKDQEPQDLDLCLVIDDQHFNNKKDLEELIKKLLPETFSIIGKIHMAPPPKKSASIKLEFAGKEIDLNIYSERFANLSQWQLCVDRPRFSCVQKKFEINNNQADHYQFDDCSQFLLAVQEKKIKLWEPNPQAQGFLRRILKDNGRLKLSPAALLPIKERLLEEMVQMILGEAQIDLRDWRNFEQQHCQKLQGEEKEDELAMVIDLHQIAVMRLVIQDQRLVIEQQHHQLTAPPQPYPIISQLKHHDEIMRGSS
ncbi:MAG: hypothetical protein V4612_05915 [Pseudomonadota bacterium]